MSMKQVAQINQLREDLDKALAKIEVLEERMSKMEPKRPGRPRKDQVAKPD